MGFFKQSVKTDYLFITYIVTSKPKRISVAAGFVHIIFLLKVFGLTNEQICSFVRYEYYASLLKSPYLGSWNITKYFHDPIILKTVILGDVFLRSLDKFKWDG